MKEKTDTGWVVLGSFYNDVEAYILKGVLETNGVPCVINNELMSSVYPLPVSDVGSIKVLIPADKLELAEGIMRSNHDSSSVVDSRE